MVLVAIAVCFFVFRGDKPVTPNKGGVSTSAHAIRYLPLGDSYTIGQSVSEADRWPDQLVNRLTKDGTKIAIVANPAVTGYTTQNLIDRELPLVDKLKPDFVTVQIGVNDYVQGVNAATFSKNLDYILDTVQAGLPIKTNVLLVTIPDYAKTPTGARFGDPVAATAVITSFNKIIMEAAAQRGLPTADIFAVSQQVSSDAKLVAHDGLHPSGTQYTAWTGIIYQTVQSANLPMKR